MEHEHLHTETYHRKLHQVPEPLNHRKSHQVTVSHTERRLVIFLQTKDHPVLARGGVLRMVHDMLQTLRDTIASVSTEISTEISTTSTTAATAATAAAPATATALAWVDASHTRRSKGELSFALLNQSAMAGLQLLYSVAWQVRRK